MLQWETVRRDSPFREDSFYDWYKATLTANVDCSEYGKVKNAHNRIYVNITFGIHRRRGNDCHSECFPFMLLCNHGQVRIYLETIEEGKQIAEDIAARILDQFNCTKERHGHPNEAHSIG
jgi:hypothetical protein